MTGFFNSRSGSTVRNYHYYNPTDTKLHDIGLSSYSRNSLEKFGKRKKNGVEENDPDIQEYLGNIDSIKPKLLGDNATLIIYRFDTDTKSRYIYTTGDGANEDNIFWTPSGTDGRAGVVFQKLKTFQEKFDLYQKGWIKHDAADIGQQREAFNIKYIWSKINNSMSGCISFEVPNYTILGSNSSGVCNIYFQSKGDNSERGVAFQPPIIAGVGRTATGQEHAFNVSETLPPGSLSRPDVGGVTTPNNTVAGRMKLHVNRGTGEWESGTTQVYCQILDDIPGVSATDLPTDVDSVDNVTLRLPLASGWGMVLSEEKGNPHLLVPNSFGCSTAKKEKIVLVNRTPRAFVRGEKILASQVDGSWVPVPLQNGVTVPKQLTFEWSQIQKYIVNAKGFFRDYQDQPLDHLKYQDVIRYSFYNSLDTLPAKNKERVNLESIKTINIAKITFDNKDKIIYNINDNGTINLSEFATIGNDSFLQVLPSVSYLSVYDADVIKTDLGGNNTTPSGVLRNTNVSHTDVYSSEDGIASASVPLSWGMYFPDGYSTSDVRRLRNTKEVVSAFPPAGIYKGGSLNFESYVDPLQVDTLNLKDIYFYHMPAQIALNASGNQTIRFIQLPRSQITAGALISYINSSIKGDWLKTSTGKDAYKLTPQSPSKVQFTPLSLELALSSVGFLDPGLGSLTWAQGGYGALKNNLNTMKNLVGSANFGVKTLGGLWHRVGNSVYAIGEDSPTSVGSYLSFGERLVNLYDEPPIIGKPNRGDRPDGGPQILPSTERESSNVVGIIAAKATISMPGGGRLQLKTSNKFGLLAYTKVTLSNSSTSFFQTGGTLFATDTGGQNRKYDNVQWGGSEGDTKITELGTTALWCAVYDHCPNTAYDGRYFSPLQFNPSGSNMDFKQVTLAVNTTVDKNSPKIDTETISIRRNAYLSNGGFAYIKKVIAAGTPSISKAGTNYKSGDLVTFPLGGIQATFKVSSVGGNGEITSIIPDDSLGVEAFGETSSGGTTNPFKSGPIMGNAKGGIGAEIKLEKGRVIEKLYVDRIKQYGDYKKITPSDNSGQGDDRGFVMQSKSETFTVESNTSGKYDIFFFFVNDILNYPEAGVGSYYEGGSVPAARYVNLEITAA